MTIDIPDKVIPQEKNLWLELQVRKHIVKLLLDKHPSLWTRIKSWLWPKPKPKFVRMSKEEQNIMGLPDPKQMIADAYDLMFDKQIDRAKAFYKSIK